MSAQDLRTGIVYVQWEWHQSQLRWAAQKIPRRAMALCCTLCKFVKNRFAVRRAVHKFTSKFKSDIVDKSGCLIKKHGLSLPRS